MQMQYAEALSSGRHCTRPARLCDARLAPQSRRLCTFDAIIVQASLSNVVDSDGSTTTVSVPGSQALVSLLGASANDCRDTDNRRACNALANLCVLQMYSRQVA